MNVPVTRTKIIAPRRRPDLLSRPRLTDMLVDLLDNKLIILAAPAGYGKTSLLVDIAHQTNVPFCWYSIDPLDRDFTRFAAYLIASINQRFPTFGVQSFQQLQNLTSGKPDVSQLVTTMVNEAYDTIQEHFVIVLDDYHLLEDQSDINNLVGMFVQAVDVNCHVVIASRTLLTLPDLPLMVARSQVGGLGFEELAFRTDEVRSLLQQNYHLSVSEAAADEIVQQTEGWITGLLLSTQAKWHDMPDRSRLARVSSVGLYDYLAQQVLDQQPSNVREFLLKSSILEEFDAELCGAVLGTPANASDTWAGLMETVLRSNLFVLPIGDKGLWLRYHHLFRDFLQNRLLEEAPAEAQHIQARLAEAYTRRGEWERAHAIYQRMGNTEGLVDLVEQAGTSLIKAGRLTTLSAWVDDLPSDRLAEHPVIFSIRGAVAIMLGQVERGLALLNHSEDALRASGNLAGLVKTLDRRAHAYRFLGDVQAALKDADEALVLTQDHKELTDLRAAALRTKGIILYRAGNPEVAIENLRAAEALYDTLGMEEYVAIIRIDLGSIYRSQGDFNRSRFAYSSALEYFKKAGDLARQATVLNNLGVLHHNTGEFEQAAHYFEQSISCAKQSGYTRIEALALASIGDLYCDLDAPDAAQVAYQSAYEIADRIHERYLKFYLTLSLGTANRMLGNLEKATENLNKAVQMALQAGSTTDQGLCHLEAGQQAILKSDYHAAIKHFQQAQASFTSDQQRSELIQTKLLQANSLFVNNQPVDALHILREAYELIANGDISQSVIISSRENKGLIEYAVDKSEFSQHSRKLLEKIQTMEEKIPAARRHLRRQTSTVPFAPAKLTINALGKTRVEIDGTTIPSSKFQAQVARDLLFLLLAHPEGLTKETIADIFWPDSNQNQIKLQFKNSIYRVRHALGIDVIVLHDDVYLFNRDLDYEYDVETFLNKIALARQASAVDKQITAYKTAVSQYKGKYLPDVEGIWVLTERQRLYHIYINAILRLGDLYLQAGEYQKCLEVCQTIFTKDPCLEEGHRLAMRAHAGLGNRADIVRQYEQCEHTLLSEVNLPPSPQTRQLYEQLVK